MNYIIEGKVIYRSVDGTIRLIAEDESQSLTLTPLVNNIFNYLISHRGELVTRQKIFDEVWEKGGLIPSSHTLNQYISLIRKFLLTYLGDIDVIITIPRVGYVFSNEVIVEDEDFNVRKKYNRNVGLWFWGLCLVFIFVIFFRINTLLPQPHNIMGDIGGCPVFDISGASNHGERVSEMSAAKNISRLADASCTANVKFYFYAQESLHVKKRGGVMLAKCIEWKESQNNCQTIYIDNWDRR